MVNSRRRQTIPSLRKENYPSFKFTPMEDGIRETVEWFEANYDKARK